MTRAAAVAAVVLLATSACGSGSAHGGSGVVTAGGRVGSLEIDVSTGAAIVAFAGRPDLTVTGSFDDAFAGYPKDYRALAYGCSGDQRAGIDPGVYRPTHRYCHTVYFINPLTHRLGTFWTDSPGFQTVSGTRPGMSQSSANHREHTTAGIGAFTGIWVAGRRATLFLESSCKAVTRGARVVCVGGSVLTIELESRHHGVGLLFE